MAYEKQKLIRLLGKEAQMQVFGEYIYTIFDVADFFGVKLPAVQGWIRTGELRAAKVGRNWWIRGSAISAFVDAREKRLTERYRAGSGVSL